MKHQAFNEYLTVSQAAAFLGVSPWTLRNWDRAGKLKPRRHPKNGYRIYRQDDLTAVLEAESGRAVGEVLAPPHATLTDMADDEHFVQFYECDDYLADSVAGYAAAALRADDAAVIIATPTHHSAIDVRLAAAGIDVPRRVAAAQYVSLDAAETLDQFMHDGTVDPARFRATVGRTVADLKRRHKRVRAFGEMVAILWHQGNREGAIDLEHCWNDLRREQTFSLFCAYPMRAFPDRADAVPLAAVCTCHSRVIPAEGYAALTTTDQRLRAIAAMQQRIGALERELADRR